MTREEVRQISSWLTSRYASRTFELVPGVNLRATVGFEGSPERASYGYMHGGGPRARVITALTRRYGPPQVLDRSVRYNNALVSNPGGITIEDSVSVRWCDGLRIFHLSGENHDFNVTITAAPAAGSAEPAVSQGSE